MMQAVSGPLKGEHLAALPISHTSWLAWRTRHPHTAVLSTDTDGRPLPAVTAFWFAWHAFHPAGEVFIGDR